MRLSRNPSIKLKLTLMAVATSVLSIVVVGIGFVYSDLSSFKQKMKSDLSTEAQVIADNCGAPLVFSDGKAVAETLQSLRADHTIHVAAVYQPDGKLVASYTEPGDAPPLAAVASAADRAEFDGPWLKVSRAIYSDKDVVGTLYMQSDLSAWYSRRNHYFATLLPLVGACLITALVLGARLQRIISKPVLDLLETTQLVSSQKRYDVRAKKLGEDEVGLLVDGFNSMLAEIEARDSELREVNDELEDRVRRRTIQLEEEIIERQLAQEELSKSQELLDDFFENAAIGLHLLGPTGVIQRANQAELEILGYTAAEYVGRLSHEFHEEPDLIVELIERLRNGEAVSTVESRMISKDGTIKCVAIDANARWDGGKFTHARCFTRDLTAQKEAERAREASAQADRANQAKSEFLSRMSHELRTPMNSILGFSQLLELDDLTPDQADSVHQIIASGRHLLRLINEVLDISRIESGNLALSIESVDARDAIRDVVNIVQPLTREKGIKIIEPSTTQPCIVNADGQRLRQILINLISNAIKYNSEAGTVRITFETEGERVRLVVSDTGPGISADKAPLLFVPFQRLGAESTGVEGTGLGLALSARLAEAMGGNVGLLPSEAGSRFYVELDRAELPWVQHEPHRVEATPATTGASRANEFVLLLVEDNAANVKLLEKSLVSVPNLRLHVAQDGRSALNAAVRLLPDLIFLDVNLPDMGGAEVLAALQTTPATSSIPVVVTSADASPTQIERLMKAGATDYLTKPLDLKAVRRTIDLCGYGGLEESA